MNTKSIGGNGQMQERKKDIELYVKDPGSAFTHGVAFVAAVLATPALLLRAARAEADMISIVSVGIFMMSMILLYGASTAYHSFDISKSVNLILKKVDHMMIFVLIAGSYTPVCLTALRETVGWQLLLIVWVIAGLGMVLKGFWVTCPKWVSSVLYIGMGWVCIGALPQILASFEWRAFVWLLLGGIFYTVGGVIYAMKFSVFGGKYRYFGCHELFHVLVIVGSVCHLVLVCNYLVFYQSVA